MKSALMKPWEPSRTPEDEEWRRFCDHNFHLENWKVVVMNEKITDPSTLFGPTAAWAQPACTGAWPCARSFHSLAPLRTPGGRCCGSFSACYC